MAVDGTGLTTSNVTELSPMSFVATMSFYSPDLLTAVGFGGGDIDITANAKPGAVRSPAGGATAFFLLGAAYRDSGETGGKSMSITHGTNSEWTFKVGGKSIPKVFKAGEAFFLDFSAQSAGTLACAWPLTPVSNVNGNLSYSVNDKTFTKRIGFWFKLNASPYTGLLAIRDSMFLRN